MISVCTRVSEGIQANECSIDSQVFRYNPAYRRGIFLPCRPSLIRFALGLENQDLTSTDKEMPGGPMSIKRRLLVFPCEPGKQDGYSVAVSADLARLSPGPGDVLIYRTLHSLAPSFSMRPLRTPGRLEQAWNVVRGRPSSEISGIALRKCLEGVGGEFEEIFSGEIFFYRALRESFPGTKISVRAHNFFCLVRCRQRSRHLPTSFRHSLNMHLYSKLEMEIMSDPNVDMLFITEEELQFAKLLFPGIHGELWPVIDPGLSALAAIRPPSMPRLVHFGSSAAAHTAIGLKILCSKVFPRIRERIPNIELHLFGHGSERYHDPKRGIHGHGRYRGDGMPLRGDGLFCIPDIHGMGIKLKVADLLKSGVPFISTPLGLSGYKLGSHPHILISELDGWVDAICAYFRRLGDLPKS